jgi:hypothetical protein
VTEFTEVSWATGCGMGPRKHGMIIGYATDLNGRSQVVVRPLDRSDDLVLYRSRVQYESGPQPQWFWGPQR